MRQEEYCSSCDEQHGLDDIVTQDDEDELSKANKTMLISVVHGDEYC